MSHNRFSENEIEAVEAHYHDIGIPRPKSHDIEIPGRKSRDIEISRHFFRGQKDMKSRFQD